MGLISNLYINRPSKQPPRSDQTLSSSLTISISIVIVHPPPVARNPRLNLPHHRLDIIARSRSSPTLPPLRRPRSLATDPELPPGRPPTPFQSCPARACWLAVSVSVRAGWKRQKSSKGEKRPSCRLERTRKVGGGGGWWYCCCWWCW